MFGRRMWSDQAASSFYIHIDACIANTDSFLCTDANAIYYSITITHADYATNTSECADYLANSLANRDPL
jgi:hypothetical protein